MVRLWHLYMTTGKTITLSVWTFVGIVMSLLFNMLSRFVTAFLPRSKCFLISQLQSPSAVYLETKKIKSGTLTWSKIDQQWLARTHSWREQHAPYCSAASSGLSTDLALALERWRGEKAGLSDGILPQFWGAWQCDHGASQHLLQAFLSVGRMKFN